MFGAHWEPGTATIVAVHIKGTSGDGLVVNREFAADVAPESGAPFRVLMGEPAIATDFWAPGVGDVVRVLVDVKRQKAKFDKSDPKISYKAQNAKTDADFQATLAAPVAAGSDSSIKERAAVAAERLDQLKALHADGGITDEEYEAQRRAIIAAL